jgi:hypothetical protein
VAISDLLYCIKKDMRQIISYILLIGLISCSANSQEKKLVDKELTEKPVIETTTSEQAPDYREIVLSENKLDTFSIPFPEKNMLIPLKNYYKPYWVESNIGHQDGPDFTYIDIARDDKNPIAYLNFDSENKFKLDEIRIVDSRAIDQYGVRVGNTLSELITSRDTGQIGFDPYHFHIYYSYKNSNILYELEGELHTPAVENVEDIVLTYDDIESHTVQSIIWRKKN